jgi:hypothetical protein
MRKADTRPLTPYPRSVDAITTTPRRAHAVYDARVVFSVDLEQGRVELAELYTESLEHFDTGLDRSPGSAEGWARWQGKAQQIVGRFLADGLNDAPLRWNTEQADD